MFPDDFPQLTIVRVLTPGGPYAIDDKISVAFATPAIGRLVAHDVGVARTRSATDDNAFVPETISVRVMHAAAPYEVDAILTLSFVDPRIARIHPTGGDERFGRIPLGAPMRERPSGALLPSNDSHAVLENAVEANESADAAALTRIESLDSTGSLRTESLESTDSAKPEFVDIFASARGDSIEPAPAAKIASEEPTAADQIEYLEAEMIVQIDSVMTLSPDKRDATDSSAARDDRDFFRAYEDARISEASLLVEHPSNDVETSNAATTVVRDEPRFGEERVVAENGTTDRPTGVTVRLLWNADRVRRFVRVVDKLFTVDRLGWYRHFFAMRLLVPDEVAFDDTVAEVEAMRHLVSLRTAVVETLGRPLLAAFMPNFTVTPEWLDSLDSPAAARAVAGLRDAIVPFTIDEVRTLVTDDRTATSRAITRHELTRQPTSTVESLLPIFIPTQTHDPTLSARLDAYRSTLLEVFAQTAQSAETVRLRTMSLPNHALDDRLWQLVGVVGESLDGLAVA